MSCFVERVRKHIDETLEYLDACWIEIGFNEEEKKEKAEEKKEKIFTALENCLKKLRHDEARVRNEITANIEKYGGELFKLSEALNKDVHEPDESLSLLQLQKYLIDEVTQLKLVIQRRRDEYAELQREEQGLCEQLIEDPTEDLPYDIPRSSDVEKLKHNIEALREKRDTRIRMFHEMKEHIADLMDSLDLEPSNSFERSVLLEMEDLFTLSHSNILMMKKLECDLTAKMNELEKRYEVLHHKIDILWVRLELSPGLKTSFYSSLKGKMPLKITVMEREVSRLEALKKQNIGRFINNLRREIEDLWDKCYIGEKEKELFFPYYAHEYTDEILELHEIEAQRLRDYFSVYQSLFDMIARRELLWDKLLELHRKANDPNRFSNRGCSLLQEEKERKRVRSELPQLEKQIEETAGFSGFRIYGQPIKEYIENQWAKFNSAVEMEKKNRHDAKARQLEKESRLGSQPVHPLKRRTPRMGDISHAKLRKVGSTDQINAPVSSLSTSKTSFQQSPKSPHWNKLRKALSEKSTNVPTIKEERQDLRDAFDGADLSSYSQFTDGINTRSKDDNMRSSVASAARGSVLTCASPRITSSRPLKTPLTVPRINCSYRRRSPRLLSVRSGLRSPVPFNKSTPRGNKSITRSSCRSTPRVGQSPILKSPHRMKISVTPRNKLQFLI